MPYYQENGVVDSLCGRIHFEGQKFSLGCKLGSADKIAPNRAVNDNNIKPLIRTRNTYMKRETREI
jgi:hypothetical protein